jgi:GT2 family glycosyltransferase
VVDNGSAAETAATLAEQLELDGLDLRVIRHDRTRGPGGGRNSGWRAARAPLIAFTDDDCRPDPEWLAAGLAAAAAHPGAVLQGPTRPDPLELSQDGLFSRTVTIERLGPQYETCNIFYPRDLLEALGGFDESFGVLPAGEDTDLAWRAIESGRETVYAPEAVVFHAVEPVGPMGVLRVAGRWSAATRVFRDHPPTREMLYRGVFWNVYHYLLWRSVLSLAGPRWLRQMVLTMHLMQLARRSRLERAGVWGVPFLALHDAVECWAVARGALRYRTFVL